MAEKEPIHAPHENGDKYQHLYTSGQVSVPVLQVQEPSLPGQYGNPFTPLLYDKTLDRAKYAEKKFEEIASGTRPALTSGGGRGHKWLRGGMHEMQNSGHIPQPASDYYSLQKLVADVSYAPVSDKLVHEAKAVEDRLKDTGMRLRIPGTKRDLAPPAIKREQKNADIIIGLPGDPKAFGELAGIFARKLEGTRLPPLILECTSGEMESFVTNMQLLEFKKELGLDHDERQQTLPLIGLAKNYGVYLSRGRDETIKLAKELHALQQKEQQPVELIKQDTDRSMRLVPEDAVLFVATGTRQKSNELIAMYRKMGVKAKMLPIDFLMEYVSPEEASGSYEGNAAAKIRAAFDGWEKIEKPETKLKEVGQRLFELGLQDSPEPLKPEKIFFLTEDSGFHFVQRTPTGLNLSTDEKEFGDFHDKIHPHAPFPGVETGPGILSKFGPKAFFEAVGRIISRYKEENPAFPTTNAVVKKSVIALVPLKPKPGTFDKHKHDRARQGIMYAAETKGTFVTKPRGPNGSLLIDNFLIPEGHNGKTEAELGEDWLITNSPRARAFQAMVYDQDIPFNPLERHKPLKEKQFNIGIVSDKSHYAAQKAIERLVALHRLPEFNVNSIDGEIKKLSDVQANMLEGMDATVLAFDPERAKTDFWRNMWIFSSLIVGEQTRDKYKLEKPLYLVNPKDQDGTGPFDYLEKLSYDLHMLGTISQDPATLYTSVTSTDEAVNGLQKHREQYLRYMPPEYSKGPAFPPTGEESHKDFNVVIFVSATNESKIVNDVSHELATKLTQKGFGVFSGGGMFSGMGTITKTLVEIRDTHDAHHSAWSTPNIMDGTEVKGKNVVELTDRFQICRDIYERIEGLLTADAAVVAPGGMGTIQELAGYAMMKQMALADPENPYTKGFKDKQLFIINSPIDIGGKPRGFYSVLEEVMGQAMSKDELEKLGIHVVESADIAIAEIEKIRKVKRETPRPANGNGRGNGHLTGESARFA